MKAQINVVPREFEAEPNADTLMFRDWDMDAADYPEEGELIVIRGRGAPMLALARQIGTRDYRPLWGRPLFGWTKVQL